MAGVDDDIRVTLNVIVLGDPEVGKTSLINRYVDDIFLKKTVETDSDAMAAPKEKTIVVTIKDVNFKVKLKIRDTAGQERFHTLKRDYYTDAQGVLVVFDATNVESYKNCSLWQQELNKFSSSEHMSLVMCGNKWDLPTNMDAEEIQDSANDRDMEFFKTSAKNNTNVDEAFAAMALGCCKKMDLETPPIGTTCPRWCCCCCCCNCTIL